MNENAALAVGLAVAAGRPTARSILSRLATLWLLVSIRLPAGLAVLRRAWRWWLHVPPVDPNCEFWPRCRCRSARDCIRDNAW